MPLRQHPLPGWGLPSDRSTGNRARLKRTSNASLEDFDVARHIPVAIVIKLRLR
jgi:hypothetical protein